MAELSSKAQYMRDLSDMKAVYRQFWLQANSSGGEVTAEDEAAYRDHSKRVGVDDWNTARTMTEIVHAAMTNDVSWSKVRSAASERGVSPDIIGKVYDGINEEAYSCAMHDGPSTNTFQYLTENQQLRVYDQELEERDSAESDMDFD